MFTKKLAAEQLPDAAEHFRALKDLLDKHPDRIAPYTPKKFLDDAAHLIRQRLQQLTNRKASVLWETVYSLSQPIIELSENRSRTGTDSFDLLDILERYKKLEAFRTYFTQQLLLLLTTGKTIFLFPRVMAAVEKTNILTAQGFAQQAEVKSNIKRIIAVLEILGEQVFRPGKNLQSFFSQEGYYHLISTLQTMEVLPQSLPQALTRFVTQPPPKTREPFIDNPAQT
ncbi:hypothetical protein KGQ71_01195 [Patescibacteria group bacterium]|nr:hypothetical protein [Patescibacteria group bacterium]